MFNFLENHKEMLQVEKKSKEKNGELLFLNKQPNKENFFSLKKG